MAVSGINSVMSNYFSAANNAGSLTAVSQIYDYKSAQANTKALLDSYKSNNSTISSLKKETADFLTNYTSNMNALAKSAGALTNGGINKLLFDGEGKTSEDSIKNTVSAVKDMVSTYNTTLSFLNKNSDRGTGVVAQIGRMVDDPAAKEKLDLAGITVNKDGSLALDEAKLTKALSNENPLQVKLVADAIGDSYGIAGGVAKDARAGLGTSAAKLVNNDIAEMQELSNNNSFSQMYTSYRGAGAYYMNNNAALGIMMNMLV